MTTNYIFENYSEKNHAAKNLNLILFGHAAFQLLNAGCELDVFKALNKTPGLTKKEIGELLKLEERPLNCLMLGLTALELVACKDNKYFNSATIQDFFANDFFDIFHDVVVFENKIVYPGQYDFVESLKSNSNVGLRRTPGVGTDLYRRLREQPDLHEAFYRYMSSWSRMSIPLLLNNIEFDDYPHILDVGGGDATVAIEIARDSDNCQITLLELPENSPVAKANIEKCSLSHRVNVVETDMFLGDFGENFDCVLFVHQLVIWSREQIVALLSKAFHALKPGGSVIIFNSITNDEEDGPLVGALDSIYFMSIPSSGGMIYPWKFYEACLLKSGFSSVERIKFSSWSPHGIMRATKN